MIKIIVDCFGGDKGVSATVSGAKMAIESFDDLEVVLTGDETTIRDEMKRIGLSERCAVVHAPDVIDCNDKPTDVVRHRPDSSMMKAIEMLRAGEADGMVSTGSTGALVAAATMRVGRLKGVSRPTFCPIMPTMNGRIVGVCDSGANVECTAPRLCQFAVMGSIYMKSVFGVKNPRVALLNVGVEEEKGDLLRRTTYQMLKSAEGLNFVGNMESRDLMSGNYDLVVCDGFSGNVLVKSAEGTALLMLKKIKKDISSRMRNKVGALFMKKMFKEQKEFMDYRNYGGSVILGTKKVIIKGHGSSNAVSVAKCIEQAYRMEANDINSQIEAAVAAFADEKEKASEQA